jgi:hypothetical protein
MYYTTVCSVELRTARGHFFCSGMRKMAHEKVQQSRKIKILLCILSVVFPTTGYTLQLPQGRDYTQHILRYRPNAYVLKESFHNSRQVE